MHVLEELQWNPSSEQLEQLITFQKSLCHWNQQVNLTRLTNGQDYWIAQVLDSLWPFRKEFHKVQEPIKVIDIGSGCGFPGFAIAIAFPNINLTVVDAIAKKTKVLEQISNELSLTSRIKIRTERAEITGHIPFLRGAFDLAMARAVASAPVVAEYLVPLLAPHGEALLYIGKWDKNDHTELEKALIPLNAKIKELESYQLPENRGCRHLIRLAPSGNCAKKYPRGIGKPKKSPLGS